jgi:hypothetical protein
MNAAGAHATELQTKVGMTARTSELSRHGCYMDMLNPLPLGTPVRVQITYQEQTIDTMGRVIYSQSNMGMGVSFDEMKAEAEALLEKWFDEARGN